MIKRFITATLLSAALASAALSQVTPAAGSTPPDDTPKYNIGATIFGDYTWQQSPEVTDADGNRIHPSSFNVSRAYINVTGNLNHRISFRITPDISRETGSGASLAGSQIFRLKYAFGQYALDDWTTHGSWIRLGVQQTPYVDYTEGIYRYRFQGTIFSERVGLLSSSDAGFSGHYNFPGNYGDVHLGFYNGENYNRAEVNDEKAVQVRGTLRPFPLGGPLLKGLRVTGFVVDDHYVQSAKRQRTIGQVTYEHPLVNAGAEVLKAKDRTSTRSAQVDSKGWSVWATPRLGVPGWELLLRHDDFTPNDNVSSQKQKRNIVGVAYWVQNLTRVTACLLLDRDSLERTGINPASPRTTTYGLKLLVNF
ncbi:MAG TPA: hypothetical protein VJ276_01930 [Thermoanaerobaculia bacterium]|nr:hypothetical protein [Thermoanaerobaculia bacterium]